MKTHKDLDVWKISMELVTSIYEMTREFPKEELYGITNQIRRSAISIPSNIAEGAGRGSGKEFVQFLYYALGSLSEVETQIIIAFNLGYISVEKKEIVEPTLNSLFKMISGLINYLKKKINNI